MNAVAQIQPSRLPIAPEQWRSINGFPGYQVSNLGRVRSYLAGDLLKCRVLRPSRGNKAKRAIATLYRDGKPEYRLVARLVCEAFHGEPPSSEHQAAHSDGDVFNDTATNLRWATPLENSDDRDAHGRTARGQKHYAAVLTEDDVRSIREIYSDAKSRGRIYGIVVALSKKHKVTIGCIEDVVYGRKWRHVA